MAGRKKKNTKSKAKAKNKNRNRRRNRRERRSFVTPRELLAPSTAVNEQVLAALKKIGLKVEVRPGTESLRQAIIAQKELNPSFTSLFLVNLGVVIQRYNKWVAAFPGVRPYYAVKSNPDPAIIKTLWKLGAGFDCASLNEIKLALSMGAKGKDIVFANPCKAPEHILFAKKHSVARMTFDNLSELEKMHSLYPDAELILRILPYDLSRSFSTMPFGRKFGASQEDSEMLLERAKDLGATIIGVSFHVGSGCYDVEGYREALESSRRTFAKGRALGFDMRLLDIGGGWPGSSEGMQLEDMSTEVNPLVESMFPNIEVISEPGRYFCTECCTLACVVTSKRCVRVPHDADAELEGEEELAVMDEEAPRPTREERLSEYERSFSVPNLADMNGPTTFRTEWMYYISDGVYGCFNNKIFDHAQPEPFLLAESDTDVETPLFPSILFGPTCDSIDIVCDRVDLPELELGSWLYFPNMGAYTISAASSFNGFEPPSRLYFMS